MLLFWIAAGMLVLGVCFYNAEKTKGGKISGAFVALGIAVVFFDLAAIVITFFSGVLGRLPMQLMHEAGVVLGLVFILVAANKFRKAMMGE